MQVVSLKSVSSGKYLDGCETSREVSLAAATRNPSDDKYLQWIIKDIGKGRISIRSVSSDQYLDGCNPGTLGPWLSSSNRDPSDDAYLQWVITKLGDGRVSIQSVSSDQYLDGRATESVPWLASPTRQPVTDRFLQWIITDLAPSVRLVSITSVSSHQYLDGRNPGMQDPCLSSLHRDPLHDAYLQWVTTDLGSGRVSIKSVSSRQYLDGRAKGMRDTCLASPERKPWGDIFLQWTLSNLGGDRCAIQSVSSSQYLDGRNQGEQDPWLSSPTRRPHTDRYLQWVVRDLTSTVHFQACKQRAHVDCTCSVCSGVGRLDDVVALSELGRSSDEPVDFPVDLHNLNLYLCDSFLSAVVASLHHVSSLPRETINQFCDRVATEMLELHKKMAIDYEDNHRRFARMKVEAMLDRLRQFVADWNDSKRVTFTTGSIPGTARIVAVEDQHVRAYVTNELTPQASSFAGTDCVFMDWLNTARKQSVLELFNFSSLSYDTISRRQVYKLHGECAGLCVYDISHEVTVAERDVPQHYELRSPATNVTYHQQVTVTSYQEVFGFYGGGNANAGNRAGHQGGGEGAAGGQVGGNVGRNTTRNWQQNSSISYATTGYRCELDVMVTNNTHADLKVHAASAIFSFGIMAAANHSVDFHRQLPMRITLDIPLEYLRPAWVTNPSRHLMHQLMGYPRVHIFSGGRALHIGQGTSAESMVLTDQGPAPSAYVVGLAAAFTIHEQSSDGRFYLSVIRQRESVATADTSPYGNLGASLYAEHESGAPKRTWVHVDTDGRLVLAKTPEAFMLHRMSSRFKHWVLHAQSRDSFVQRRQDGQYYATATTPDDGSEVVFARTHHPPA